MVAFGNQLLDGLLPGVRPFIVVVGAAAFSPGKNRAASNQQERNQHRGNFSDDGSKFNESSKSDDGAIDWGTSDSDNDDVQEDMELVLEVDEVEAAMDDQDMDDLFADNEAAEAVAEAEDEEFDEETLKYSGNYFYTIMREVTPAIVNLIKSKVRQVRPKNDGKPVPLNLRICQYRMQQVLVRSTQLARSVLVSEANGYRAQLTWEKDDKRHSHEAIEALGNVGHAVSDMKDFADHTPVYNQWRYIVAIPILL